MSEEYNVSPKLLLRSKLSLVGLSNACWLLGLVKRGKRLKYIVSLISIADHG